MSATGIHHVTAISSDARANRDFYAGVFGLRAVKKTVNFDDPQTYHLYYGDEHGSPGSILTFFPYKGARAGTLGRGIAAVCSLAVPAESMTWWKERLSGAAVEVETKEKHGEPVLAFVDPDGLRLELVGTAQGPLGYGGGTVPADRAIRGVHSVTLWVPTLGATRQVLHTLGFVGDGTRLVANDAVIGRYIDLEEVGSMQRNQGGAGTIHHVAFRVGEDDDELVMRKRVIGLGLEPTPVIDRQYFHSVYFREPGGVLFELATDPPGFDADEPLASLGEALKLPPQYEQHRRSIESGLPDLPTPATGPVFIHRWEPQPEATRTILALHGTGGDETDLIGLAQKIDASANVLLPRGRVDERGMPRFFRRLAEGVFDEASVLREAKALAGFVRAQAERYGIDAATVDAVGYSNGANIASAAMLLEPNVLRSAVLMRPMVPLRPKTMPDLGGRRILLLAGKTDPIAPPDHVEALATLLGEANADVTTVWQDAGHELTGGDLDAAAMFFS
jgi:predicted esterase/catechol 2,3-dioxygenase-like lactoylglutathione lyase family enzyme